MSVGDVPLSLDSVCGEVNAYFSAKSTVEISSCQGLVESAQGGQ